MEKKLLKPDYLFEVSWEVCNKVGGIHTVISTKAQSIEDELKDNYILIGPDVIRDTDHNPEFIEDTNLFKAWKKKTEEEGISIRIGRWNIPCQPIAIIVNFSGLINKKDEIFKQFWELYKLDSISGQWDYIEPALFGYAAGRVIESFTKFYLSIRHRIVAQFHEWMTGSGLLYLKKQAPQVGTVFTTHATVLGRCIAGNNLPLYTNMQKYNPQNKSHEFNVTSKQSIESIAAQEADCFTTVSEITANECINFLGKNVDLITPNGFEKNFVPQPDEYKLRRVEARVKFFEVTEAMLATNIKKDSMIVGIGGRYEFKNKGIDVFIEALGQLNKVKNLQKDVLAFILIPAGHHGPRKDVFQNLIDKNKDFESYIKLDNKYITHYLNDPEQDPILNKIGEVGLSNSETDKVKVFYVPCYLNGADGIFNKSYYDMLLGMDISVFPSYYEPWGYTPLESLAFKVPTVTTTLAGFGQWVNTHCQNNKGAITVIPRDDHNDEQVVTEIVKKLVQVNGLNLAEHDSLMCNAEEISNIALWSNFVIYYHQAFNNALMVAGKRTNQVMDTERNEVLPSIEKKEKNDIANWTRIIVHKNLPENLKALDELSRNLWWCWNTEAKELFKSIDKELWEKCEKNPILLLEQLSFQHIQKLEKDENFVEHVHSVYLKFTSYMMKKFERKSPKIAYFSMEYGLHSSLKIYSGGLGILAGDYLKETSDQNVDIVGIGLLYKYGYFHQNLSASGQQVAVYDQQNFAQTPASPVRNENGKWLTISIALPGRQVNARIWKVEIGRTDLYLLDTDYEDNQPQDRSITHHLYGGDLENRFKQEMLLGVGGVRLLAELNITPEIFHLNEGHAAFAGLERLRMYIYRNNLSYNESLEAVRATSLYTTHTPVPAGHDAFPESLVRTYMSHYPGRLKISWSQFMDLGRMHHGDSLEKFSMSHLAINLSQEVNGVSWLHGEVSRKMFVGMWPGYFPNETHVSFVTNGVHFPTWAAKSWKELLEKGSNSDSLGFSQPNWQILKDTPDEVVWEIRNLLRSKLIRLINKRFNNPNLTNFETPRQVIEIKETLNDKKLTIGFARRFATYKRAYLLFKDLNRLNEIVNNPERPVQFLFAGKAHPNDKAGQDLIKQIVEISEQPQFLGKIIFLQNYDMELARHMVQGVDVWLNTPTRPLEASGTSGQKAVMNGVLHFSVLDGWWVEGYRENAGWMLAQENTYENNNFQDELDSELIYTTIENEIVPAFYERNEYGTPEKWVSFVKKSMIQVASNFTTTRMISDYQKRFYDKLYLRSSKILDNDFQIIKELAAWKRRVERNWDNMEIIQVKQFNVAREKIVIGKEYDAEITIDLGSLSPNEIGVEMVATDINKKDNEIKLYEFSLVSVDGPRAHYAMKMTPIEPGVFDCGIRIYPKNQWLPHRMDFCLVRWA